MSVLSIRTVFFPLLALAFLAGCAGDASMEFNDPYERTNRKIHNFNKAVDRALLRPAGNAYGAVFTDESSEMMNNFTANMAMPRRIANNLLQFRIGEALVSTLRFGLNTTLGWGGLFDVATEAGMTNNDSDFGMTLHRWGVGEGVYVELPFFAGRTARGSVGLVVDLAFDPLNAVTPAKYSTHKTALTLVEMAGDRHEYSAIFDEVLYNAEDSYATQRLYYLQNRRFELNDGEISDADLENPYDTE
ncbi:hypothetical protein GCM10007939_19690 [Amylibacter marinus]|uniref:Phospholipid-binding lipoprotein MlaA n=1 Tax=Amylibacter marinus TaxID=1475483 RepID=A0ABQ5VW61_9RHOB|nr:VacJ family lipoprotein [Amylibacter marinus]GLQ35686.1 hypothetical protein GCM10007939_19690 [Amylibacter marinus]